MTRLAFVFAFALAVSSAPALAAQCTDRAQALQALGQKYGEGRLGAGLAPSGQLVEVFVSDQTGTWTVLVSNADGRSCLLASGSAWETTREPAVAGEPG